MAQFDIGLFDAQSNQAPTDVDEAVHRVIDIVAQSAQPLADAVVPSVIQKVLVFGADSDTRAHYLAERHLFPGPVASPLYDEVGSSGVFWVTEGADLEELDDASVDLVLVFNISHQLKGSGISALLQQFHRVLKRGGSLAGTGTFQTVTAAGSIVPSVSQFRALLENNRFFVQQTVDLTLYGGLMLVLPKTSALTDKYDTELRSRRMMCVRFAASKLDGEVDADMHVTTLLDTRVRGQFDNGAEAGEPDAVPSTSSSPQSSSVPLCDGCTCGCDCLETVNETIAAVTAAESMAPAVDSAPAHRVSHQYTSETSHPDEKVVVVGASIGLPNALRPDCSFFDPRNFDRVFAGENCISQLTPEDKQHMLDQNIVQVLKVDGKRVKKRLTKPSEVISLASKLGHFDLVQEYGVPANVVETLDITFQLAIAAGLEALSAAGVPVLERRVTEAGADGAQTSVPTVMPLPAHMQEDTGIIFASSFPCTESLVEEVTKCASHHAQQLLLAHQELQLNKDKLPIEEYEFDRKLLFKLLVMANAQLAELIHARGPNTHVNAACASTTQAVAMAEDWIRMGRCRRVVVLGADNSTSSRLLPYVATGFLALTAASIAPTVETGALPFDKRRNGMILGMGAVALVLESTSAYADRVRLAAPDRPIRQPLAELVASHFLNSAFHASLLDREHISVELTKFIDRVVADRRVSRDELARELVYFSHETCTFSQGGCAKAEMDALSAAFGDDARRHILIANTKGFTGHPMGVGLEDAVAVVSLDTGMVPPIANFREIDPCLGDILLAHGGKHTRKYGLRFAAGFGSQFTFLLFKKWEAPAPAEVKIVITPPVPHAPSQTHTMCVCMCDNRKPSESLTGEQGPFSDDVYFPVKPLRSFASPVPSLTLAAPSLDALGMDRESSEVSDESAEEMDQHKLLAQNLHRINMSGQNAAMAQAWNEALPSDADLSMNADDGFRRAYVNGRPRQAHADVGDTCSLM